MTNHRRNGPRRRYLVLALSHTIFAFVGRMSALLAPASVLAFSSLSRPSTMANLRVASGVLCRSSFSNDDQHDDTTMQKLNDAFRQQQQQQMETSTSTTSNTQPTSAGRERKKLADRLREASQIAETVPSLSSQGIYQINSKEQHSAFLRANPDKLVLMKFKAAYCRACAALEPKFLAFKKDEQWNDLPIVWAEMTASPQNKDFFRRLGVLSLPTIHFYDGPNGLVENFACGPAKMPILAQKLKQFVEKRVDPDTRQLKQISYPALSTTEPRAEREILIGDELVTSEHIDFLRNVLPFFEDLSDDEFDDMLSKARLQTYLPGDVVMRQGMPPTTFYVVKSGTLEMLIRSRFDDPISTPPTYLGAVVNQLGKFDYFGERALTTGEPYAASVRVVEKTRCFAFNVEDIPASSILSKKRRANQEMVDKLSARYVLPEDYVSPIAHTEKDESILELLVRFKQIRQAAKCFEYVLSAKPLLGDKGEIARRATLVSKLSNSQRQDFVEVFNMADRERRGSISLLDMRRFMGSARKELTDEELLTMMNKANPLSDGPRFDTGIGLNEFMGVMAEAEFYSLFLETFQELDRDNTGYVRAGDLDEVLHGVRDLISDDRKSIIDVDDQDVQVDYEQFAKMLLGASL